MIKRNQSSLGIDLSDRTFNFCWMTENGAIEEGKRRLTVTQLTEVAEAFLSDVIIIEAGTPSSWVDTHLTALGRRVVVADPRKIALITKDVYKSDVRDARMLARLGLADETLLSPTYVRSATHRFWMALVTARDQQVRFRTATVLEVRSQVKTFGGRLPPCDPEQFDRLESEVPQELRALVAPLFSVLRACNMAIKQFDAQIEAAGKADPAVAMLSTVQGVGPITALAFVALIGDPARFRRNERVGAYLGLVQARDQSGKSDPDLSISKHGNGFVRRLLVTCAHYVLARGKDSALKRWAQQLETRRGKKIAVVALARRIAVTLLSMWKQNRAWQPFPDVAESSPDAPSSVVLDECDSGSVASDFASESAPSSTTRTQPCADDPSSSSNGSPGAGASEGSRRKRQIVPASSPAARPATPSVPATPVPAGDPASLASGSSGQARKKRGRLAAEGMIPPT